MTTEALDEQDTINMAYRAGQLRSQVNELLATNAALRQKLYPGAARRILSAAINTAFMGLLVWFGWFVHDVLSVPALASTPPVVTIQSAPRPTWPMLTQEPYQPAAVAPQAPEPPTDVPVVPSAPQEAAGDVYIIVTPTIEPLPEPGDDGFAASFQEPTCSAMVDYLKGHRCYQRTGQAPLPQPGDSGFAASFK